MPLELKGSVALAIRGEREERLEIDASDFIRHKGGVRVLGNDSRHEFVYKYTDNPRFELTLMATAMGGTVVLEDLLVEAKGKARVEEQANTLRATFIHDPDVDDEPLTPISSN